MQCIPFLWYLPHILRPTRLSLIRPFLLNHTEETQLLLSCSYFHSPILVENALTYRYVHKTCNEIDATCHGQKLDFWLCHVAHCITNRSAAGFLLGLGLLMREGSARRCFLGCERLLKQRHSQLLHPRAPMAPRDISVPNWNAWPAQQRGLWSRHLP